MDFKRDFEADWQPFPNTLPSTGERCIVTDGNVIVMAIFTQTDDHAVWLFQGLTECANENFKVRDWMPCPRPKLRSENENDLAKDM